MKTSPVRLISTLSLAIGLSVTPSCSRSKAPDFALTFNGSSEALRATEIVPTLDAPIPKGKNAIWCASFLAGWKALEGDLAGGPIELQGAPGFADTLNRAVDPRPNIPEAAFYVGTGWNQKGVLGQIAGDLKRKFPSKSPPRFPGITADSFVMYCYLEASIPFPTPYFQNPNPLDFTDGSGTKTKVNSFGLIGGSLDDHQQRTQAELLFCSDDPWDTNADFAIDLCASSSPSQIVIARISPEPTLAAALDKVESKARVAHHQSLGGGRLLVPEMYWAISHTFSQIKGKQFKNPKLAGQSFDIAQQDIQFRLDKSGAAVKSEAQGASSSVPMDLILDRPFLIYLKKRGAENPYFAMWVDNAELIHSWPSIVTAR